mmetsp:Transcript_112337/g.317493  ORF Transcript_112337/g.317493 Transcript_112337/m.317493 type:complete len:650 (-) Transcript_112337:342-2291(-)|eukprot:CAMPEP_0117499320 /NCGR_PEP_ID=MMETSP0784-20121206/22185_1 /TAXON_ID=39447 /ORGANISM="" /LENGTH=649 /DNA_ID=CAMNT_0005294465 /DNA_START=68 /DNA_END=2017 /DNA_ORIENTATION=-
MVAAQDVHDTKVGQKPSASDEASSTCSGSSPFPADASSDSGSERGNLIRFVDPTVPAVSAMPHVTLSHKSFLTWAMRQVPMLLLYGFLTAVFSTAFFADYTFAILFLLLTVHIFFWMCRTGIFGCIGVLHTVPAWERRNWVKMVEEAKGADEIQHYVIIPSYKEGFAVLDATLGAIAESSLAKRCIRVVLAMEERDGTAEDTVRQLYHKWADCFLELFATYHPAFMPNEIAGKSSNTNWAFQEVSQRARALELDPLRTVISVNDADCLWHPQYFEAVTLDVLEKPREESQWLIWQAPQLQLRNHFDVPLLTKITGYSSALFEIGGLNCPWSMHICYSSYTMLLSLADRVGGWDADVIAEDHHMFCKCWFASVNSDGPRAAMPRVRLQPVFLPLKSYLVESSEGSTTLKDYWASVKARFVQARRHMQGITELSYVLLQWVETLRHHGVRKVPLRVHFGVLRILWAMLCVHNLPFCHILAVILANVVYTKRAFGGVLWSSGAVSSTLVSPIHACVVLENRWFEHSTCIVFKSMPIVFAIPTMLLILGSFVVVVNFVRRPSIEQVRVGVWQAERGGVPATSLLLRAPVLLVQTALENVLLSWIVILFFGFVPELMAVWHLARVGTEFAYVTADKPTGGGLPRDSHADAEEVV